MRKTAFSGGSATIDRSDALIYGGVALGVLAGAAVSTWIWRQKTRAQNLLNLSPLERAEQLISSCETKLDSLEETMRELQENR